MNASQTKTWVLFQTPWVENEIPKPYKPTLTNASNTVEVSQNYAKLPFIDNQSLVTVDQQTKQTQRWDIIKNALQLNDIKTVEDFRSAVKSYNPNTKSMNFDVFQVFIDTMKESERDQFFSVTLKNIIKLALQLPQIVTQPIPLLRQRCNSKLYLSQYQISCLLANAFLCTFPDRESHELYNYQDFSFIKYVKG
jgi:poly(ADP-ribose) glycohydrolase